MLKEVIVFLLGLFAFVLAFPAPEPLGPGILVPVVEIHSPQRVAESDTLEVAETANPYASGWKRNHGILNWGSGPGWFQNSGWKHSPGWFNYPSMHQRPGWRP